MPKNEPQKDLNSSIPVADPMPFPPVEGSSDPIPTIDISSEINKDIEEPQAEPSGMTGSWTALRIEVNPADRQRVKVDLLPFHGLIYDEKLGVISTTTQTPAEDEKAIIELMNTKYRDRSTMTRR